ncbi:NEAT domain-containing protein, partial [Priestia megaterium]|uniref:NEAT domain-containing protein n=1 Tax=Priestia megaterium TaxID=1404 RepID=UPI002846C084
GTFELQFVMYKNSVKNNTNISMANEGFHHPCTLTVENGEGLISLKAKNISRKSRLTGKKMNGKVSVFRYFDGTSFVEAERQGNI